MHGETVKLEQLLSVIQLPSKCIAKGMALDSPFAAFKSFPGEFSPYSCMQA